MPIYVMSSSLKSMITIALQHSVQLMAFQWVIPFSAFSQVEDGVVTPVSTATTTSTVSIATAISAIAHERE